MNAKALLNLINIRMSRAILGLDFAVWGRVIALAADIRCSRHPAPIPGSPIVLESPRNDDSNDMRDHGWYVGAAKLPFGSWTIR